jgi:hypothetical protein
MRVGLAAAVSLAMVPLAFACGSGNDPGGADGGSGPTAGAGTSGAQHAGGTGGTSAAAGTAAGTASGGTTVAGSSGAAAGAPLTGDGGKAGAGAAGTPSNAGTSGGDPLAGFGGGAGVSASGTGGTAGSAGSGGSGGTGMIGAATFQVDSQLASEVDPDAPGTVGIVTWTIDKASLVEAFIEFGLDTSYGMQAPVDLALQDHRTLLLGMKPARTYHFRVVARDASATYQSDDFTIETGPATTLVPLDSFEVLDEEQRERGFILASYWRGTGAAVPFILDADGEVVWWYQGGPNGIARARLSADAKNMWMIAASNSGEALRRVSMDGLDAETYTGTVGSHDLTPVSGATMAYLDYGESDCDSIFEIDPSGETTEVWDSQLVAAGMCHGNALRYSRAEDVYTFSDVSTDIFVVSRSGTLEWRLSELVSGGNDAWGGTQHGHHLLADSIVVFANRGAGSMASTAVEYALEGGAELLNFDSGDFTANLGDVQRLPGGNTLVTYSNDSIIKEIDPDGNVVLEIDGGGSSFGYTLWTPSLYAPAPDTED